MRGLPEAQFPGGTRSLSGDIYNLFAVNRSCNTSAQAGFPLHELAGERAASGEHHRLLAAQELRNALVRVVEARNAA